MASRIPDTAIGILLIQYIPPNNALHINIPHTGDTQSLGTLSSTVTGNLQQQKIFIYIYIYISIYI